MKVILNQRGDSFSFVPDSGAERLWLDTFFLKCHELKGYNKTRTIVVHITGDDKYSYVSDDVPIQFCFNTRRSSVEYYSMDRIDREKP